MSVVRNNKILILNLSQIEKIIQELKKRMQNEPDNFDGLMFLISVSRNLERIGDYATNIAEDIFYLVSGDIIRHHVQLYY